MSAAGIAVKARTLRAFEVGVKGQEWSTVIHAMSAGKAKYEYLLDVRDFYPDISFAQLTCRTLGEPQTNADFLRTATYRGVPFAKIGMKVEVGGKPGVIVGKNYSANFDVVFDDGTGPFNCHPNWMFKYFDESGGLIKEFTS